MKKDEVKGYLFVIASALIFGCMPLMAKFIYADGVNPLSLVLLRNLLSLPVLALFALLTRGSLKIPVRAVPTVSLVALMGCCVTPVLLFYSYQYISSGTATVFHFIYPAVVVLFGMFTIKQKRSWQNALCLFLCVLGVVLFYDAGEGVNLLGGTLALLSGVTYAVYILLLSAFRYKDCVAGFTFCFYVSAICSAVLLILALASGQLALPNTPLGFGLCLLFALVLNVGAVLLFQKGTFLIGGERASILSTLEPTTSVLVGIAVFHEPVSVRTLIGAVLVLAASVLIALFDSRGEEKQSEKK